MTAVVIMSDRVISGQAGHKKPPAAVSQRRFTLRTLFIVSVALAVPFLLMANLRNAARPDDSLASPLYLLFGVAAILIAAAIGNALAHRLGTIVTACAAGLLWILLVALLSQFSDMLSRQLPVHIVVVIVTIAGVAAAIYRQRESTDDTPHEHLVRLLKVKSSLHEAVKADPGPSGQPKVASDDVQRN
jgi:Na+/melibiose symporter-like transporter